MENEYLYPGGELVPVSVGENYREFMLGDILRLNGLSVRRIELLYARKKLKVVSDIELGIVRSSGCYVALVVLSDGRYIAIAPLNYHHNLLGADFDQFSRALCAYRYTDACIRYYINSGSGVFRPVWSFLVSEDGSKKMSIGPEIPSSFYLLDGNLIFGSDDSCVIDLSNSDICVDKYFF